MKPHQVLEIVGLLFLLISVGWELFFSMAVESIEKQTESIRLHDKLDQLRARQLQLQRHLELRSHKKTPKWSFQDIRSPRTGTRRPMMRHFLPNPTGREISTC